MDEYLLKARFEDAKRMCKRGAVFLGFYDPAERAYLSDLIKYEKHINFRFWGGYDDAQRTYLSVSNYETDNYEFPFQAITVKFRDEDELNHRDMLGTLMSLGVTRQALGDILVENGRAVVFVKEDLAEYFVTNLTKIAKVAVKCSIGYEEDLPKAFDFKDVNGVVASERADCIIAFLTRSSREKSSSMIKIGNVNVNYKQISSVSHKVKEKDIISVRGYGKFMIDTLGPRTKKDRLAIKCKKYI